MKRRKFLNNISIVGLGYLVIPTMGQSCKKEENISDGGWRGKVAIIGAGAAGLQAAKLLADKGVEITIFEAKNRIGGRINSLNNWCDIPIELGAEEVHGSKTLWYDIVKNNGASFKNVSSTDFFELDGILKNEDDISADADYIKANTFITGATNYSGTDKSVYDHLLTQNINTRVHHIINAQTGNEYGTDYSKLSIKGITEEDQQWTAGYGNYQLASSNYTEIINKQFSSIANKIKLNSVVTKIEQNNTSVNITVNGNIETFDRVIIAVPLSQLQNNSIAFLPALPSEKIDAINNIGMGKGMKVIMLFNSIFWDVKLGSITSNGASPEYWFPGLGRQNAPVLTAFINGNKAEGIASKTDAEIISLILADIERLYPGKANSTFNKGYVMNWIKEPFIEGSYSYPKVGGGLIKRENLFKPVNKLLFFAGEACNYKGHSGTAHGAIETGNWAAEEILKK